MDLITDVGLWELVKHLKQWLLNLRKAGQARKAQSIDALRAVIVVSRQTRAYVRQRRDRGRQDHAKEAELSTRWTELGFLLEDLQLGKLAKRCDIKGRYWADPEELDRVFVEKADVGLEQMERLAKQTIAEIEAGQKRV